MKREELPNETPREDKMREALKHYEELATKACWHRSDIPEAIRAYYAPLPPAEGAEEYLRKHPFLLGETEDGEDYLSSDDIELIKQLAPMLEEFATPHAHKIADKMKEANQFILDIAQMLGIETDGVGFDGITLSIDDFREAADKMVEEQCIDFANWLDKLQPSDRTSVWSKNGEHKGLFTMDNQQLYEKYLKSRDSHEQHR